MINTHIYLKGESRGEQAMGKNLRRNLTDALELPKEVLLNLPLLSITGREELCIENYKGIIEYTAERIRINTGVGIIKVEGKGLLLKHITAENVVVTGALTQIHFMD